MLAPARIPVAAGKKMANTEKKVSSSRKSGPRFSRKMEAADGRFQVSGLDFSVGQNRQKGLRESGR